MITKPQRGLSWWRTCNVGAALLVCTASTALATSESAEELLSRLRQSFPSTQFTAVRQSPVEGLFEVQLGNNVAYVTPLNPRYFIFGRMFDTETMKDVSSGQIGNEVGVSVPRARSEEPTPVRWADLPIDDALTMVIGSGKQHIAVFSDPACPFCVQLERELAQLDDIVIHTFVVPFQGEGLPAAIWCAPSPVEAWQRFMKGDTSILAAGKADDGRCRQPIRRNLDLAKRLAINGTPTILFQDGERLIGAATAQEIHARLGHLQAATAVRSTRGVDRSPTN